MMLSPSEKFLVQELRGTFEGHEPTHIRADVIQLLAIIERITKPPAILTEAERLFKDVAFFSLYLPSSETNTKEVEYYINDDPKPGQNRGYTATTLLEAYEHAKTLKTPQVP